MAPSLESKQQKKNIRKMARALPEEQLARDVFNSLQAVSCPLVEDVKLQDSGSFLQLLTAPSQHRTDILSWICCRIDPNFCRSSTKSTLRSTDQEELWTEMALLGQELMLCRAAEQDLLREGGGGVQRQLLFLQQLLTLVPGSQQVSGSSLDTELLLCEMFAAENVWQLSGMLTPRLEPRPAPANPAHPANPAQDVRLSSGSLDISGLLQVTTEALQQLQAECDFLKDDPGQALFSPGLLRVAAGDLQQLMAAFVRVYEADLRSCCLRAPPTFSPDAGVFQRTQQLLDAFVTELEVLQEAPEAVSSLTQEVELLETRPSYRGPAHRSSFNERLEQLMTRLRLFSSLLH